MRSGFASVLLLAADSALWNWIHRLGGPGLVLLGLADNSAIPLPGSMDVFTILLAAHRPGWWWYYAFMATAGSVLGGFLTYRLAREGGEEALHKKVGKEKAEKFYRRFEKRGGFLLFLAAILPPPFPIVPFLMAAGILEYPAKKFLSVLAAGRAARYFILAGVAHAYGSAIISALTWFYRPALTLIISLGVFGGVALLVYLLWYRPRRRRQQTSVQEEQGRSARRKTA